MSFDSVVQKLKIPFIFASAWSLLTLNCMEDPKRSCRAPIASNRAVDHSTAAISLQQRLASLDVRKELFEPAENNPTVKYYAKLQTVLSLCTYMYDLRQSLPEIIKLTQERLKKQNFPFVVHRLHYLSSAKKVTFDDISCSIHHADSDKTEKLPEGTVGLITPLGGALGYLVGSYIGLSTHDCKTVLVDYERLNNFVDILLQVKGDIKRQVNHGYSLQELSELNAVIDIYQGECIEGARNSLIVKDYGRIGLVQDLAYEGNTYLTEEEVMSEVLKWLGPGSDYKPNLTKWLGNLHQFMEMYCPAYIRSHLLTCRMWEHAKIYLDDNRVTKSGNILVRDTAQTLLTDLNSSESAIHTLARVVKAALLKEKLRMTPLLKKIYGSTIWPRYNDTDTFFEQPVAKKVTQVKITEGSKKQQDPKKRGKKSKPRKGKYKTKEIAKIDHAVETEMVRALKQQGAPSTKQNAAAISKQVEIKKQLRLKPFKGRYTRSLIRWQDPGFQEGKSRSSIIYHTFNTLADRFIKLQGKVTTDLDGLVHYEAPGILEDLIEGKTHSVIFHLIENNSKDCIIHRGINNNSQSEDIFHAEEIISTSEEEALEVVNTHPLAADYRIFENPFYTKIPDPINNLVIYLFKPIIALENEKN